VFTDSPLCCGDVAIAAEWCLQSVFGGEDAIFEHGLMDLLRGQRPSRSERLERGPAALPDALHEAIQAIDAAALVRTVRLDARTHLGPSFDSTTGIAGRNAVVAGSDCSTFTRVCDETK
jgi:hypothetical protein